MYKRQGSGFFQTLKVHFSKKQQHLQCTQFSVPFSKIVTCVEMKDVLVRWNLRLDALENRGCDSSKSEKKFPF